MLNWLFLASRGLGFLGFGRMIRNSVPVIRLHCSIEPSRNLGPSWVSFGLSDVFEPISNG